MSNVNNKSAMFVQGTWLCLHAEKGGLPVYINTQAITLMQSSDVDPRRSVLFVREMLQPVYVREELEEIVSLLGILWPGNPPPAVTVIEGNGMSGDWQHKIQPPNA